MISPSVDSLDSSLSLPFVKFTKKESDIISLLASGYTQSEVASLLSYTSKYLSKRVCFIRKKYNLRNSYHLVAVYVKSTS